MLDGAVQVL
jgi:hypothetical protein